MEEKSEAVAVDTYAILAMAYGELGKRAEEVLTRVRRGEAVGYLPATVVYELCVHWLRGRIPTLKSMEEVVTLVSRYFRVVELKRAPRFHPQVEVEPLLEMLEDARACN